jgi:hypothetical protein
MSLETANSWITHTHWNQGLANRYTMARSDFLGDKYLNSSSHVEPSCLPTSWNRSCSLSFLSMSFSSSAAMPIRNLSTSQVRNTAANALSSRHQDRRLFFWLLHKSVSSMKLGSPAQRCCFGQCILRQPTRHEEYLRDAGQEERIRDWCCFCSRGSMWFRRCPKRTTRLHTAHCHRNRAHVLW